MTTPAVITAMPNHLYQGRDFLRKILDRMLVKTRLHPESIWKEEAEVRVRPMKRRILLVRWNIAAGMKRKGLKGVLFCSSVPPIFCFLLLYRSPARKRRMQLASPRDRPQHWRKG